jgi:hypothetical protein
VEEDNSPPLLAKEIKCVQDIVGTLLYYGRAVNSTLLALLSTIVARQSHGTKALQEACHQLLDYVPTHLNAGIRFHASDMILAVHTDASYLSKPSSKSRAARHFYLTKHNDKDFNNGAVLTLSSIIEHVMSSASEAELAALYYGCKQAAPIRVTLEEMGHRRPAPTPITTDNITAQGLTTGTMTPKSIKIKQSTVPLAQMPQRTMPIHISLAQRNPKLRRLRQQTPPSKTSSTSPPLLYI